MKRGRKGQRGYTLIEVVVALAVAAVLFSCMIAVMAPVYRIYARTRERADAQLVAGVVLDSIRAASVNARFLEATSDGSRLLVGTDKAFWVEDGVLMYDDDITDAAVPEDTVLARGVYNGKSITLFCNTVSDSAVDVTITVNGEDGAVCALTSRISPLRAVLSTPAPAP